jgi:VWFA-related protein
VNPGGPSLLQKTATTKGMSMKKATMARTSFLVLSLALATEVAGEETATSSRLESQENDALDLDVDVERVEVDVLVVDRFGKFVHGLGPKDFEVTESGKPVKIEEFELRSLLPEPTKASRTAVSARAEAVMPEPRKFILFVDMLNSNSINVQAIKPYLTRFVTEVLHPADEILIAILTFDQRALVLQTFTPERERILQALEVLKGSPAGVIRNSSQERDIYALLYPDVRVSTGRNDATLAQIQIGIQMATDLVRNFASAEYQRSVYSLNALASVVERVHGAGWQTSRKTVIYVSEGLPMRPAQRLMDVVNRRIEEYNALLVTLASSGAGTRLQNLRLYPVTTDQDIQTTLRKVTGRLNRCGATLYTLDARGVFHAASDDPSRPTSNLSQTEQMMGFFENQDSLNALAVDTGGLAYFNRQNFDHALREIERDNRLRYFLTYTPPKHKKDKKPQFYAIKVKCKIPHVRVRNRIGYID